MGTASSAILSEIFIQCLQHNEINQILTKHNLLNYFMYVDDALIIYDEPRINIDDVLSEFNSLYKHLQFTMEKKAIRK